MAVEGVEFGVEVDCTYNSVAASWFGFAASSNNSVRPEKDETKSAVPKKRRKRDTAEVLGEVHVKEPDKHGGNLSSFIDAKLTKKLKKSKQREQQHADEEGSISSTKTHSPGNAEEDSKTAIIVKKKTRPSYESLPSHSVESLTKRLESGSLSQSTRKRLRKRLNRLIKESGIDEKVKNRSSALPGKDENSSSTRSQDIKIRESLLSNMEDDSAPIKRKKKKKRSKQKNIKKDNRPDHMKPPHLRNNALVAPKSTPLSPTRSANFTSQKEKVQIDSVHEVPSISLTSPKTKNKEKKTDAGTILEKSIADNDASEKKRKKTKAKD